MKLTKISKWFWLWLIIILVISIATLVSIFIYKIDKTEKIKLYIDEHKMMHLIGNNKLIYSLKEGQKIMLQINNKNFEIFINFITIQKNNALLDITTDNYELYDLIKKDMTLDANLFYGQTTLFKLLFGNI
ncbi:MAG1140 family protein [Mycoplasmopsis primatum]|uniref:MAG1140 family protein n=1 Tax=Mycoplasmopsis primatum TaxID=55604 RepID=UPI0004957268|nr:hypothetical protein [Mycoplasmopsis primatum]